VNLNKPTIFINNNISHAVKEDLAKILGVCHTLDTCPYMEGKEVVIKSILQLFPHVL